jgi:hypothetical protein
MARGGDSEREQCKSVRSEGPTRRILALVVALELKIFRADQNDPAKAARVPDNCYYRQG